MKEAKCIIFDFNGTLYFDYDENYDGWNEVTMKYLGIKIDERKYQGMLGMTDQAFTRDIFGNKPIEELDKYAEEKEDIYKRMCIERNISLEKKAVEFLLYAKSKGIKLMICSSAPRLNMDWYIETLHLERYFRLEDIISGRLDIPSKPAPDIYRYAIKMSGFKGKECIAFEDAPGGLRSALGAGFNKVYAIDSPKVDTALTSSLAPLVNWDYVMDNKEEIIRLKDI